MAKIILFDVQFGSSGDMLLGSLLDAGMDYKLLSEELRKLNLDGWSISPAKTVRYSMSGTFASVSCVDHHHHRNLDDITAIINKSTLADSVRRNIISVFTRLALAESSVHGTTIDRVHFHEVGAIDSIVDISAFCISMDIIGAELIYFGDICLGTGSIMTHHGEIPNPAPAVLELTRGFRVRMTGRQGELITPTAAAILTALGKQTDVNELYLKPEKTGVGFGSREYPFPSYTRAIIAGSAEEEGAVIQLECNIDDMNPQIYPHVISMLIREGALDAYIVPIIMKKGRPGLLLVTIAGIENIDRLREIIYRETTTIGLRVITLKREKIDRFYEKVSVLGCDINIKIGKYNGRTVNVQPEFEDCRAASEKTGVPIKEMLNMARDKYGSPDGAPSKS
jgi:uncharacterized protein (TIGR00299 family) protein